ncbi:hypothetical protein EJB05_28916, partial [Eragrostis curvula]
MLRCYSSKTFTDAVLSNDRSTTTSQAASTPPPTTLASTPSASPGSTFLPWLVAPRDATERRKARCVFSPSTSEICVPDRRWVISAEDGTSTCWLDNNTTSFVQSNDPVFRFLNGSASSTPVPLLLSDEIDSWEERAVGVSSGDGTVVLYAFGTYRCRYSLAIAIRPPGEAEWGLLLQRKIYANERNWQRCCVAYRNDKIILCNGDKWRIMSTMKRDTDFDDVVWRCGPNEGGMVCISSHLVESRKELLWAFVEFVRDVNDPSAGIVYNPLNGGGGKPRWVKRDRRSLADRVLFLGRPGSLAMDAARFGMSDRGCAYFVDRRQIVSDGTTRNSNTMRSRVFKYSFHDRKLKFMALLPEDWTDKGCMWITPQPSFAPTEEIGERLQATHT